MHLIFTVKNHAFKILILLLITVAFSPYFYCIFPANHQGKQSQRVLQEVKQKRSGKLNIQDIKALDSSSKSIYLTV